MPGLPDVYMKFADVKGDCLDEGHLGKDGWFTISNFSFGVRWGGSGETPKNAGRDGHAATSPRNAPNAGSQRSASDSTDGTLKADDVTFGKAADSASIPLLDKCYTGKEIPEVIVEACRPSGVDKEKKVAFLRFTFKRVRLKQAGTSVAEASLPTESYRLEISDAQVEYIWTDNSTGERLIDQPCTAGWDFEKKQGFLRRPGD